MTLTKQFLIVSMILFIFQGKACLYFNKNFDPKLFEEKEREVFMFHDGVNANMIVKSSYHGKLPSELTWVLPLPSKPVFYKEIEADLFSDLRKVFSDMEATGGSMSKGFGLSMPRGAAKSMIQVHADIQLGNYKITPIEILSENGGQELNKFLEAKGFFGMPEDIQKPYLKKGTYFLAINMQPKVAKDGTVNLKPLWISYSSGELKYPLKFTHDYRTYDITLYFYTLRDAMYMFSGSEKASTPWGSLSLSGIGDAKKNYPSLYNFVQPINQKINLNKNLFKNYFLEAKKKIKSMHSGVNFIEEDFDSWVNHLDIYRMPFIGVNKNFKTRELKEDPGLRLY